jgi:hypothetical protein
LASARRLAVALVMALSLTSMKILSLSGGKSATGN